MTPCPARGASVAEMNTKILLTQQHYTVLQNISNIWV